jgi:DNA replication protein DnaC
MATAIVVAICNRGKKVKFYRTAALVNDLSDAKNNGNLNKLLKQLEKIDLFVRPPGCSTLILGCGQLL